MHSLWWKSLERGIAPMVMFYDSVTYSGLVYDTVKNVSALYVTQRCNFIWDFNVLLWFKIGAGLSLKSKICWCVGTLAPFLFSVQKK